MDGSSTSLEVTTSAPSEAFSESLSANATFASVGCSNVRVSPLSLLITATITFAAVIGSTSKVWHIREKTSTSNLSDSLSTDSSDNALYITSVSSILFLISSTGISTDVLYSVTNLSWKVTYKSGTLISNASPDTLISFRFSSLSLIDGNAFPKAREISSHTCWLTDFGPKLNLLINNSSFKTASLVCKKNVMDKDCKRDLSTSHSDLAVTPLIITLERIDSTKDKTLEYVSALAW